MGKYTEEKKQYYMGIIKTISEHADFGKRNPVDIGIDCGYTEEDVLEMIEMLRAMQEEEDKKRGTEGDKSKQGIYYFFIRKAEGAFIVRVNRNTWKVEVVEEIADYNEYNRYDIKGNIFVRTYGKDEDGQKTVVWENIESKETKKLLTEKSITNVMILDTEVLVLMEGELLIWNGKDILARKKDSSYFLSFTSLLFETEQDIYIITGSGDLHSIDKELKNEFKDHGVIRPSTSGVVSEHYSVQEIGVDDGKIFGFGSYERYGSGFFNTKKYRIASALELDTGVEKQFPFDRSIRNHKRILSLPYRDFTTKNYGLLGTEIYSREQMESESDGGYEDPVCIFERCLPRKQVIAEYDRDTFIALSENDDIIKIDLKNEREAVVLPVNVSVDK